MEKIHKDVVHKLGNLTIAPKSWNAKWKNIDFVEKCLDYKDSILRVQKQLDDYDEWTIETIQDRGSQIIEFALNRWSIE